MRLWSISSIFADIKWQIRKTTDAAVACSACFRDQGLKLDAEQLGISNNYACPNCKTTFGKKLSRDTISKLAYRFFVRGTFVRCDFGAAPRVQFNEYQRTSIEPSDWLANDIALFESILKIGFFHYGPRLWMIGEVEPLKALQLSSSQDKIIRRLIVEYPTRQIDPNKLFYRVRTKINSPELPQEYDSPPAPFLGKNRFDSPGFPVMYASPDLQVCVHECRISAEDELYVAALRPARQLRFLDLTALIRENDRVTEFESIDIAVHLLFLAGEHSYKITRSIAKKVKQAGFDGIIYPSYFSQLRTGTLPLETISGISQRKIQRLQQFEAQKAVPNYAIFGRPIKDGLIVVDTINKLILNRVMYDFHFGPVIF